MYTEIVKIIEGALDKDKEKVINYAKLLAKKIEENGDKKLSDKIIKVIENKSVHPVYLDELMTTPVDQESRMNMVDVIYPPKEEINIILSDFVKEKIDDFIASWNYRDKIHDIGLDSLSSLLLYGPPGCGKTSIALYISYKTQLPLVTARLDSLVSSLLGSTAKNIRKVFDFAKRKPCILFLDEFDAIAKARDDKHELGELKRVVNSLLQNIDEFNQNNMLIAATNHHELLDSAIWRRFSTVIEVAKPNDEVISRLLEIYLSNGDYDFKGDAKKHEVISKQLLGYSPADIKNICHNVVKKKVINNLDKVTYSNFLYEIYLFNSRGTIELKDLVKFLNENGVSKVNIQEMLNLSVRQVASLLKE